MLNELLSSMRTRLAPEARGYGFAMESAAMIARHRRCRDAWSGHLDACAELIMRAAGQSTAERCVVIGSGPGLEIPIERLSTRFAETALVDIAHPPAARRRAALCNRAHAHDTGITNTRRAGGVQLVYRDVTGMLAPLAAWARGDGAMPLPAPVAPVFASNGNSLIVSANILSQIGPFLKRVAARIGRGRIDEAAFDELCRAVIDAHITALLGAGGTACLIAETARIYRDADGREIDRDPALPGVTLPAGGYRVEWEWHSAPIGELDRRYSLSRAMVGIVYPVG